jgi:hypothetical protein
MHDVLDCERRHVNLLRAVRRAPTTGPGYFTRLPEDRREAALALPSVGEYTYDHVAMVVSTRCVTLVSGHCWSVRRQVYGFASFV